MNIAFFTDSYHPYVSGVVNSIERFKKELEKEGHKVYIFAPAYPDTEKEEGVFRYISIPAVVQKDFRLAIPYSRKLIPVLKSLELDIIHTHTPFLMGFLARHAAHKLRLPLVFTFHTLYDQYLHYLPLLGGMCGNILNYYLQSFCNSCDLIVAPSKYVEADLKRKRISTPVVAVSTGIDLAPFKSNDEEELNKLRKAYNIHEKEEILLFVSRLGEEKNPFFLLEAYHRLIDKYGINPPLFIVGDGPEREKMERYCQKKALTEQVIFTGKKRYAEVVQLYKMSTLFVFPSKTETQGLVTLEAMAGGLPVVAVNAAGSSTMVEDGVDGFLVQEDPDEFARAIYKIMTDDMLYNKMRINAFKKAEELSIERMAARLLLAYKTIRSNKQEKEAL